MLNRLSRWLLIAIVIGVVSLWWLLIAADRGTAPAKPIHIAELRTLAASLPGRRPTDLSYTVLASRMIPGDFLAAGTGLKRRRLAIVAWTLPIPGKHPVMIDPDAPPAAASVGQFANFNYAEQGLIDAQARTAGLVLMTQGHLDEPPRIAHRPGKAHPAPPVSATSAQAVAPGVVVIPASSHVPDARLIFVQLADGREFLFAGNIAPFTESWAELRARSHLAAERGPAQDRAETYAWLRTIRQLRSEAPKMKIVPGHDDAWLTRERTAGVITPWQP